MKRCESPKHGWDVASRGRKEEGSERKLCTTLKEGRVKCESRGEEGRDRRRKRRYVKGTERKDGYRKSVKGKEGKEQKVRKRKEGEKRKGKKMRERKGKGKDKDKDKGGAEREGIRRLEDKVV